MQQSVYPQFSQVLQRIFEAVPPEEILLVPIDFAKRKHVARFCDGHGRYLHHKALTVHNTMDGAKFLQTRIERACAKRKIKRQHVILGGEDTPSYSINFMYQMKRSFSFVRVNATQAQRQRTNLRTTSDTLALDGIAKMMLDRRARDLDAVQALHGDLLAAARERHRLIAQETAAKNAIHRSLEILFPGYCDLTGIHTFEPASLALMEDNFHALRIKRRKPETLTKMLKKHKVRLADEVTRKLQEAASNALPCTHLGDEPKRLANRVSLLRIIRSVSADEQQKMAFALVQTPGFYLTTIPGVGVATAGQIYARLGPKLLSAGEICSYSGIIPRGHQSGGPDQPAQTGHLPRDCNRVLKSYIMQGAYHVGTTRHGIGRLADYDGHHQLYDHYHQVSERDGKSRLSTAQKLVRIGRRLMLDACFYLPAHWLESPSSVSERELEDYYQVTIKTMAEKWKPYDLSAVPKQDNRLQQLLSNLQDVCEYQRKLSAGAVRDA